LFDQIANVVDNHRLRFGECCTRSRRYRHVLWRGSKATGMTRADLVLSRLPGSPYKI
jgi:hypothetical protein